MFSGRASLAPRGRFSYCTPVPLTLCIVFRDDESLARRLACLTRYKRRSDASRQRKVVARAGRFRRRADGIRDRPLGCVSAARTVFVRILRAL